MNLLLLGRGKTGSLVAEVARQRGHDCRVMGAADNPEGRGITAGAVSGVDVVIEFTTPHAVLTNIDRCAELKKNIVVGATGWYGEMERVRRQVECSGIGLVYASNFSPGVNLFFDIARAASPALRYGYSAAIEERHHVHKKDAPSGTAVTLRQAIRTENPEQIPITSLREGDVMGDHTLTLDSAADTITLTHFAKSRRGFAEGAVRAAEWLRGRSGFFDFRDIWREV